MQVEKYYPHIVKIDRGSSGYVLDLYIDTDKIISSSTKESRQLSSQNDSVVRVTVDKDGKILIPSAVSGYHYTLGGLLVKLNSGENFENKSKEIQKIVNSMLPTNTGRTIEQTFISLTAGATSSLENCRLIIDVDDENYEVNIATSIENATKGLPLIFPYIHDGHMIVYIAEGKSNRIITYNSGYQFNEDPLSISTTLQTATSRGEEVAFSLDPLILGANSQGVKGVCSYHIETMAKLTDSAISSGMTFDLLKVNLQTREFQIAHAKETLKLVSRGTVEEPAINVDYALIGEKSGSVIYFLIIKLYNN